VASVKNSIAWTTRIVKLVKIFTFYVDFISIKLEQKIFYWQR